jgi:uncharacterized protein YqhQ
MMVMILSSRSKGLWQCTHEHNVYHIDGNQYIFAKLMDQIKSTLKSLPFAACGQLTKLFNLCIFQLLPQQGCQCFLMWADIRHSEKLVQKFFESKHCFFMPNTYHIIVSYPFPLKQALKIPRALEHSLYSKSI